MPGSDIEAFIEELEDLINNAKSPLSGRRLEEDHRRRGRLSRSSTTSSVPCPRSSRRPAASCANATRSLDSAEEEAAHIVKDAEDKANTLASEQEVVRLANNMAEDVRRHAEEEAREDPLLG